MATTEDKLTEFSEFLAKLLPDDGEGTPEFIRDVLTAPERAKPRRTTGLGGLVCCLLGLVAFGFGCKPEDTVTTEPPAAEWFAFDVGYPPPPE